MPKINVYLPDELAAAVRDAQLPVSAVCQTALERAVRDVSSVRAVEEVPGPDAPGLGLFSRFTPRARRALTLAEEAARAVPHDFVGTEHVLLGVIDEGDNNVAVKVLESLEIEPPDLRAELLASMAPPSEPVAGPIPFTLLAKAVLERTAKEALGLAHNYIGTEHLLLGLLATEEGLASKVLRRMGLELRTTRRSVIANLSGLLGSVSAPPAAQAPAAAESTLEEILRRLDAIERRLAGD
jgi:ATP-dependent Clp protease ATP-binding subunit ClpC